MTLKAKCIRCGKDTGVPATCALPIVHQTCQVLPVVGTKKVQRSRWRRLLRG